MTPSPAPPAPTGWPEIDSLDPRTTVITSRGGEISVTDGPFTEAKEAVVGWAIVDVKSKEALLTVVENLRREGKAILVVSGELEDLRTCDRVLVMRPRPGGTRAGALGPADEPPAGVDAFNAFTAAVADEQIRLATGVDAEDYLAELERLGPGGEAAGWLCRLLPGPAT